MRAYRALVAALIRSSLREPVGVFFSIIFAPLLVIVLGLIFGNDPKPEFGDRGYLDVSLPAFASLVPAITGVTVPVNHLQLRGTGALRRLRATPLRSATWIAADLTQNFVVGMVGLALALSVGVAAFGVDLPASIPSVLFACALGLGAFLALGYTLAAIYPSSTVALAIGNPLVIVLLLTSGVFIPLAVLPPGVRAVMWASPVRHFVDLVQGLWAGQAWEEQWPATAVLAGMFVLFGFLGIRLFRWDPA